MRTPEPRDPFRDSLNFPRLLESQSTVLPHPFSVTGATKLGQEYLVWSAVRRSVLAVRDGKVVADWDSTRLGERFRPIAATRTADGTLEVLDRGGQVFRHGRRGVEFAQVRLPRGTEVGSAVYWDGTWTIAVAGSQRVDLLRTRCASSVTQRQCTDYVTTALARIPLPRETSSNGHLFGDSSGLIFSFAEAPFDVASISASGAVTLWEPWVPDPVSGGSSRDRSAWLASLPTIRIGEYSLQTIADLGSDTRWLVLRSAIGGILRTTRIDAPMGFIASSWNGDEVLGARHLERTEFVVYSVCAGVQRNC